MLLVLLLAACTPFPWLVGDEEDTSVEDEPCQELTWYTDGDGDGFGLADEAVSACTQPDDAAYDPGDCDDTDPAVNPRAVERCNGVDDDCDGVTDPPEAEGALVLYRDADGDGWGTEDEVTRACNAPAGWSELPGDCDDADPDAWPGAEDAWYDGVDSDCAGNDDYDADVDAHRAEPWGGDCDDADDTIFPGAAEHLDGVDEDCDGLADQAVSLEHAHGRVLGAAAWDGLGGGALAGGDLDGDGVLDLALGIPDAADGAVFVVAPSLSGDVDLATTWTAELTGEWSSRSQAGAAIAVGDTDGDGYADLLVGAPALGATATGQGAAYLVLGPLSGSSSLGAAEARLLGSLSGDAAGCAVHIADVDGDGLGDLLVGAEDDSALASASGAAFLVPGPVTSGDALLEDSELAIYGPEIDQRSGNPILAADLDGDGRLEIVLGSARADGSGSDRGAIYVLDSSLEGVVTLDDADAALEGDADGDKASVVAVAPDVDGDGLVDLVAGAPLADNTGANAGAAYLITAHPDGEANLNAVAEARLDGSAPGDSAGTSVAGAGDLDGDGLGDLVVGAPADGRNGALGGSAWIVLGGVSGASDLPTEAWSTIEGSAGEQAGTAVWGGADLDGDGTPDLAVSAPGGDPSGRTDAGLIGLFAGWAD